MADAGLRMTDEAWKRVGYVGEKRIVIRPER